MGSGVRTTANATGERGLTAPAFGERVPPPSRANNAELEVASPALSIPDSWLASSRSRSKEAQAALPTAIGGTGPAVAQMRRLQVDPSAILPHGASRGNSPRDTAARSPEGEDGRRDPTGGSGSTRIRKKGAADDRVRGGVALGRLLG